MQMDKQLYNFHAKAIIETLNSTINWIKKRQRNDKINCNSFKGRGVQREIEFNFFSREIILGKLVKVKSSFGFSKVLSNSRFDAPDLRKTTFKYKF